MKRRDLDLGKEGNNATNFRVPPPPPPPGADPELLEPHFMQELIHFHGNVCEKLEMSFFFSS